MRFNIRRMVHVPGKQMYTSDTLSRLQDKEAVWWPGLSRQIEDMVSSCRVCARHRINKPEPLCQTVFPERPWQVVETDLFYSKSVDYLLVVDYFSRYVEVAALRKTRQRQRLSGHLKLFLQEMESLRRSALTTDPHMIFKNTAILQENGVFRLHQVTPGMSSQMVRQRELYRQLRIF